MTTAGRAICGAAGMTARSSSLQRMEFPSDLGADALRCFFISVCLQGCLTTSRRQCVAEKSDGLSYNPAGLRVIIRVKRRHAGYSICASIPRQEQTARGSAGLHPPPT